MRPLITEMSYWVPADGQTCFLMFLDSETKKSECFFPRWKSLVGQSRWALMALPHSRWWQLECKKKTRHTILSMGWATNIDVTRNVIEPCTCAAAIAERFQDLPNKLHLNKWNKTGRHRGQNRVCERNLISNCFTLRVNLRMNLLDYWSACGMHAHKIMSVLQQC